MEGFKMLPKSNCYCNDSCASHYQYIYVEKYGMLYSPGHLSCNIFTIQSVIWWGVITQSSQAI